MNWVLLWLCLSLGNFIYQAIRDKDWQVAFERSFFEGVAIVAVYMSEPWI